MGAGRAAVGAAAGRFERSLSESGSSSPSRCARALSESDSSGPSRCARALSESLRAEAVRVGVTFRAALSLFRAPPPLRLPSESLTRVTVRVLGAAARARAVPLAATDDPSRSSTDAARGAGSGGRRAAAAAAAAFALLMWVPVVAAAAAAAVLVAVVAVAAAVAAVVLVVARMVWRRCARCGGRRGAGCGEQWWQLPSDGCVESTNPRA